VYFATFNLGEHDDTKNRELRFETEKTWYKFDFFIQSLKLLVEFDGEWYHSGAWRPDGADTARDADIIKTDPDIAIIHVRERDFINNPTLTIAKLSLQIHERLSNRQVH